MFHHITHLNAVTDIISEKVAAEAAAGRTRKPISKAERNASDAKQKEVMQLLDAAISKTEALEVTLAKSQDDQPSPMSHDEIAAEIADASVANAPTSSSDKGKTADAITDGLTGKDSSSLGQQTKTLSDMAKQAEPIIDTFNKVLSQPGLDKYNASVNTAPVMGFKDGNVMYIQTKSNRSLGGAITNDVWSVFSKAPDGYDASKGATHFFPYSGNLYIANGTTLWVRKCRSQGDPELNNASNNWPKMYQDSWEKVGDQCLPANDIASIIPWAQLSADHNAMKFQLVTLMQDGTMQVFSGDAIYAQNSFNTLTYSAAKDQPPTAPVWRRIAYHNGLIIGYDKDYNLWDVKADFSTNTYTVENKYALGQDDTLGEYTANDIGLVVSRKDGFLYKRIADTVDTSGAPSDGNGSKTEKTKWVKWIALDGVSRLGIASPGVILDLDTLTKSLKSRYIETQATLVPVVNNIKTFAATHEIFLNQMNASAKEYENSDDIKKQKLALKAGKTAVGHAKAWSKILLTTVNKAEQPVALMAKQLSEVKEDLDKQIGLLKVKLTQLKSTLEEQKKALEAAQVGFWAGIASMLVGLIGVIAGLATGQVWLVVGAGLLFAGGIIAASVSAAKADTAAAAVARTNSDISNVETAIRELTLITDQFGQIDKMYGVLNMFWGRMLGNAMSVGSADDALIQMIGMKLLTSDSPSYVYATELTGELKVGAQAYLDLIFKQGVKIDLGSDEEESDEDESAEVASLADDTPKSQDPLLTLAAPMADARAVLESGDSDAYEAHMVALADKTVAIVADADLGATHIGDWFNIALLRTNAAVFSPSNLRNAINNLGISAVDALAKGSRAIGSLLQSHKNVTESLQATIELAKLMAAWSNDPFSEDSDKRREQLEVYKRPALKFARLARDCAVIANNSFAEVNTLFTEFGLDVQRKIQEQRDEIRIQEVAMDSELRSIDVPFPLQLFAPRDKVMQYVQSRARDIANKYEDKTRNIQRTIDSYQSSLESWLSLKGQSLSWIEVCKIISKNLGNAAATLDSMGTELKVDALLYRELMVIQWHNLLGNAQEVMSLIGQPSNDITIPGIGPIFGFNLNMITGGNLAALMSVDIEPSAAAQLTSATAPDAHLAKIITSGTSSAANLYASLRELTVLPFASEMNSGTSSKSPKSMLETVADIRRQYAALVSDNFVTINLIRASAYTQQFGLRKLAKAGRRDVIVKQMLIHSTATLKSALRNSETWANAEADFDKLCAAINMNVETYGALMKDLEIAIAKQQKELDDYIAGIAADAIAVCVISGAAGAAVAFGPAIGWKIISQLGRVYDKAGVSWKDAFKTFYKDLNITEKAMTISRLRQFKTNLDTASKQMVKAKELFSTVVDSTKDVSLAVGRMHARLVTVSDNIQTINSATLEQSDIDEISLNWQDIAEAADSWMDEFSRQGLSPILNQFDNDVNVERIEDEAAVEEVDSVAQPETNVVEVARSNLSVDVKPITAVHVVEIAPEQLV